MFESKPARRPISSSIKNCVLLVCLFAPSAWMIATIPPLWRDVDAYNQLARDPLVATFWGHAPAYCYAAKVPLLLGAQWERWRGIPAPKIENGSYPLTDSGVGLLILTQHVALCGAAFYLIVAISNFFWIRLALALAWASNALFYTFGHCVGSETLSVILIVLLVGQGLRLIRSRSEPSWTDWYGFALCLCLCLLSRHVNAWLVFLLPAAFFLLWAQNRISGRTASSDRQRDRLRRRGAKDLSQVVIALAIGIACIAVANFTTHGLARKTRFQPHSRIGFTFFWRLHFLKDLSAQSRAALFRDVAARTRSPETRKLIALLEQMHNEGADLNAGLFMERAIPLLFPDGGVVQWVKLDDALNQMAFAFLLPPTSEHLHVTTRDFVNALKMPATEISSVLFETTTYYFERKDEMPACAELATFRGTSPETINRMPSENFYFQLWRLTYNKAFVIWFISLVVFIIIARWKKVRATPIAAFGIALTAVGLPMVASACLLTEFLPRYVLPMWQLLLLSFFIFVGGMADLLSTAGFRRFALMRQGKVWLRTRRDTHDVG